MARRVLITGGARGIGLKTAQLFRDEGDEVAIWALHPESLEEAARQLPGLYADVVDVGDELAVKTGYTRLKERFGPVDVLINNAGYTLTSRFLDEERDYWNRVVATNLWGVIFTCHAVLPDMRTAGTGTVVNVVSDAGRVGMAGEAVYAACKGGVVAFSKSLAQEMAKDGIRINCVSPGPTRTRILEENQEGEDSQKLIANMIRRIPLRRIAEPEEIAHVVVFLASPRASHVTGQVLSVSGGLTMV